MSKLADLRWALCIWAKSHGHSLEDTITLVDAVEERTDGIEYANSESERNDALEEYGHMVISVTEVYNSIKE